MFICEVPTGVLIDGVMYLVNIDVTLPELVRYFEQERAIIATFEDSDVAVDFQRQLTRLARLGEAIEKSQGKKAVVKIMDEEAPDEGN